MAAKPNRKCKTDVRSSAGFDFLTVRVDYKKDWMQAVCLELLVSGFGSTIPEALEACGRSMQSTLKARRKSNAELRDPARKT